MHPLFIYVCLLWNYKLPFAYKALAHRGIINMKFTSLEMDTWAQLGLRVNLGQYIHIIDDTKAM